MLNPYKTLRIEPGATEKDVNVAYRELYAKFQEGHISGQEMTDAGKAFEHLMVIYNAKGMSKTNGILRYAALAQSAALVGFAASLGMDRLYESSNDGIMFGMILVSGIVALLVSPVFGKNKEKWDAVVSELEKKLG